MEAILSGAQYVEEASLAVCNTDEIRLGLNIEEMIRFHKTNGAWATMAVTYSNNLHRHRVVHVGQSDNRIIDTQLKPTEYLNHPRKIGFVNTGFIVMNKRALEYCDPAHSKDWGGIIYPLVDAGQLSAYIDRRIHYFNVGTQEKYEEAEGSLRHHSANS